ncbi:MAG: replication-relaxation family protein [Chloroflexi bacterium]|nr:replication-relaxation family protein [Chloroflexota bacterium]
MVLTDRDREIVRWVAEVGVATREHVQAMFFGPGGRSRCQHRLALLFQHRYLDRLPRRVPNAHDTYHLSRRSVNGLRLLRATAIGDRVQPARISRARLQHSLDLVSCRVHITCACEEAGFKLLAWLNTYEVVQTTAAAGIVPDAFFRLARPNRDGEDKKSAFFLEVERSDKSGRALMEKFRRYGEFYYGGAFEQNFGTRALRVLVLIGSDYGILPERRVEKLTVLAEQTNVTFLHFAPLAAFLGTPPKGVLTESIWRRPGVEGRVPLFSVPDLRVDPTRKVNSHGN